MPNEMQKIQNNENPKICSICGGMCCRGMSGAYHPSDIEMTFHGIIAKINNQHTSIDWAEECDMFPRVYYMRPRHLYAPIINPSWGGVCSYYGLQLPNRCALSFEERPYGCRMLVPDFPNPCGTYDKNQIVKDWLEYNELMEKVLDYVERNYSGENWLHNPDPLPSSTVIGYVQWNHDDCTDDTNVDCTAWKSIDDCIG